MFSLYAKKNQLTLKKREPVTSGSVNVYPVRFEFSADWDGLTKTAIFRAHTESRAVLLDESGETTVPWEVLTKPDVKLFCGVYGTQDGHTVLPTIWAEMGWILRGAELAEETQPSPTPELWQQELDSKGDALSYDGQTLSLMSGDKPLSSVQIVDGGEEGKAGATFIPSVSEDGLLSWTNNGGLENPEPVNIKGPLGLAGSAGENATINGVNALEIVEGENISITQEGGTLTISATGGTSQEVYSTEETRIGTWIDGRPLYRKTYAFEFTTSHNGYSTTWKLLETDPTKVIHHDYGELNTSNNGFQYCIPYAQVQSGENYQLTVSVARNRSNGDIYLNLYFWADTFTGYVTIEYTKTTDQPTIQLDTKPLQSLADMKAAYAMPVTAGGVIQNEEV